jgi:hypothetical protein
MQSMILSPSIRKLIEENEEKGTMSGKQTPSRFLRQESEYQKTRRNQNPKIII